VTGVQTCALPIFWIDQDHAQRNDFSPVAPKAPTIFEFLPHESIAVAGIDVIVLLPYLRKIIR